MNPVESSEHIPYRPIVSWQNGNTALREVLNYLKPPKLEMRKSVSRKVANRTLRDPGDPQFWIRSLLVAGVYKSYAPILRDWCIPAATFRRVEMATGKGFRILSAVPQLERLPVS